MSKPTHYPLTMDEFLKLNTILTDAELRVYLYLMIKNPFPDSKIEIDTALISEQLGLTRRTVQRSIKRLSELQLIEIEVTRFKYKKATHGASSKLGSTVDGDTRIANDDTRIANDDTRIANDDTRIANAPLKPPPSKAFDTSQTIQTYTDFIQTLSEDERESFEKFVREEWKKLTAKNGEAGKEIISLERFLAREEDIKNWYDRFLNSPAGREAKRAAIASIDWMQNPDWSDWLAQMREGVPRFVALGTCFDNKTRRAIADWADERGLIWGTES